MKTFTWRPTSDATGTTKFRILKAQFGDGYAQTAADGINNKCESWPLTFVAKRDKIIAIKNFLDATNGVESFQWTPPLGQPMSVKVGEYTITPKGADVYCLAVTFEQDFQP